MKIPATVRDYALAGMFGAAGLLLPFIFHVLHLGHVFMPMYIPLVALPFLVRPGLAMTAGFLVPLLSTLLTSMPPLYPPVAQIMASEIALVAGLIAVVQRFRKNLPVWLLLLFALSVGRMLNAGLSYLAAAIMDLPAGFLAGISFISGWPGILLMLIVVPPVVRLARTTNTR